MKILPVFITLFSFLTFHVNAQLAVPVTARDVTISKISPEFQTTPEFGGNIPQKRSKSLKWLEIEVEFETKPPMIDELTFGYTVFMNGKLYTGEITHVNIAQGRNHYSVMYISPRALEKITGGRSLTQGMIENIEIEVKKSGMILGKKALAAKPLPNLERIPGFLVPKSETPFHVLWWDRYEEVKSTR